MHAEQVINEMNVAQFSIYMSLPVY